MSDFEKMAYEPRRGTADSKPLGAIEINGESKEFFIPNSGAPDLYVEGISEPIIKVEVDFVEGQGWKATDLLENPNMQTILQQISESEYKNYVEEVASYINHLNQEKPNGI